MFLPADSLPLGLTRSYWLAFALARVHEVYYLRWCDPRAGSLAGRKGSNLDSLSAFARSLFAWPCVVEDLGLDGRTMRTVRAPVLLNAVTNRFVGELNARRWARWFNARTVRYLARKLEVDAVFHGDGFYYFPESLDNRLPVFADIQDDFDAAESEVQAEEQVYGKRNFGACRRCFAVGAGAARHFEQLMHAPFQVVPNGVDLRPYRAAAPERIDELRRTLAGRDRFVISYIGTGGHLDRRFALELADALSTRMPDATLLIVGPSFPARKNVVSAGFVDPAKVHEYFLASDAGICPAPNPESRFIYHSVPLKVVQYGAARKFVLSVPNLWLEEQSFPNVRMAPMNLADWVEGLAALRAQRWRHDWDGLWQRFDWDEVARPIVEAVSASGRLLAHQEIPDHQ